ncbi:TetR/AcrR family transcriptional regulator [Salinispira pacifica]|uniref:Transcriptional regulator, TetR family n=1 Tax=Salinispira pacifica TaxID=1307761 RepID=V5WIF5_9SPIO|nr:TetR/AcrR family transcriptional regulator [Salinispira pacifica]AHC15349.1 Transcriptional regulator, TetR family [Salinispira pacifica]
MAKNTKIKLRDAALNLFSNQWFETVSIAEICRQAAVSNGVFYRYYPNKAALVKDLLDEFLAQFRDELLDVRGDTIELRLENLIATIYRAGEEHSKQVTVFREGQYRFPEYEEQLRSIYMQCCKLVYERDVSEAEYLYIISGLRFCSTRALYDGVPRDPDLIRKFILNGIFSDLAEHKPSIEIPEKFAEVEDSYPEDSRERLIQTGMKLIGSRGYHDIGVADIVRVSGLAVGTFYTYFDSKEQFFSIIIDQIGKQTRHYLSRQAMTHGNRLEQEIYGVWHFLSFFNVHTEYYSIVREAEFVGKPWVREYYNAFEEGYMQNLTLFPSEQRRIAANFLMGLSHYVGIEALLNKRIINIPGFISELSNLLCKGVDS